MQHIFIRIPKNGCVTVQHIAELNGRLITAAAPANLISPEYAAAVTAEMESRGMYPGLGHARWRDLNIELRENHAAVAIVRNPWSRVLSRYNFAFGAAKSGRLKLPDEYTFEMFLDERHTMGNLPYFWHRAIHGWYPQKDYITDETGVLKCDILRFEYFDEDLSKYFDLKNPIQPRNVSNGKKSDDGFSIVDKQDYRDFYTDETREIIADWYKDDIEFFGFTFDGPAIKNIWNVT